MSQFYGHVRVVWVWSYESSAVGDAEAHLLDIVRCAERRNAETGVSGILAYDSFGFYQLLEGPFESVADLRASILRDRRHRVNWERMLPAIERRTPVALPLAFIRTGIPHGDILKPENTGALAAFEAYLLNCAAQAYPMSYARVTRPATMA